MNMQLATGSSRAARRIVRDVLSNGWMLVVIGYMAALLSIALWAAWQLVVLYAEPRRELILEVDRTPARLTRISTELLGTSGLSASCPANAQCAGAADLRAPRSLPGLAGATSITPF